MFARLLGNERLLRWMIRLSKQYGFARSDYIGTSVNGLYGVGERYRKKDAFPLAKVAFEGKMYPTLGCYEGYLKGIYGDYMTLPPKEKRTSHKIIVWAEGAF